MNKFGIYVFKNPRKKPSWSLPFIALNDEMALNALFELSKSQPELSKTYLYKIGSYNVETASISKLKSYKLILSREVKNAEEVQN